MGLCISSSAFRGVPELSEWEVAFASVSSALALVALCRRSLTTVKYAMTRAVIVRIASAAIAIPAYFPGESLGDGDDFKDGVAPGIVFVVPLTGG